MQLIGSSKFIGGGHQQKIFPMYYMLCYFNTKSTGEVGGYVSDSFFTFFASWPILLLLLEINIIAYSAYMLGAQIGIQNYI